MGSSSLNKTGYSTSGVSLKKPTDKNVGTLQQTKK